METDGAKKTYPYKKDFSVIYNGRIYSVWAYDRLPDGMRQVGSMRDLRYGQMILYKTELCDAGEYLTEIVRPSIRGVLEDYLKTKRPIYAKIE